MNAHDYHYTTKEQPREQALRAERADRRAGTAPDVMPERPDVEQGHAYRLRKLAAAFMAQQTLWMARAKGEGSWRTQINDGEEIKQLCKEAADGLGPLINRALMAAERHEALASVCVNHKGAT